MQNYTESVPAIQKALAVLDHLRQSGLAPTLTELSQALAMNRSILLAVLNTLRSAGFVVRDSEDRYRLGPELLSYGRAAAKATAPVHVFHEPGDWLVDVLGESAGLFALSNTDAVCLAACPARRAIGGLLELVSDGINSSYSSGHVRKRAGGFRNRTAFAVAWEDTPRLVRDAGCHAYSGSPKHPNPGQHSM